MYINRVGLNKLRCCFRFISHIHLEKINHWYYRKFLLMTKELKIITFETLPSLWLWNCTTNYLDHNIWFLYYRRNQYSISFLACTTLSFSSLLRQRKNIRKIASAKSPKGSFSLITELSILKHSLHLGRQTLLKFNRKT